MYCRVYQVASVKSDWNCVKTFPDLSGTGFILSQIPLIVFFIDIILVTFYVNFKCR